ncbi:MAG: hypothetical protein J7L47_05840 [Candidatus Odinarchaeota archaeon]|nr:hypothetical protein [Candidatus Odinarchaeota archaeon]
MGSYLLCTVGFYTQDTIKYSIIKNQCDKIVFFASPDILSTAEDLKDFISKDMNVNASDISIIIVNHLDVWDVAMKVKSKIQEIVEKNENANIVVDVTGGTRIMTIGALIASVITNQNAVYHFKDDKTKKIAPAKIPKSLFIHKVLPWKKKIILEALYNYVCVEGKKNEVTYKKLKEIINDFSAEKNLGISPARISEDLTYLEKLGLLKKHKKGSKTKYISLTYAGKKYVQLWLLSDKYLRDVKIEEEC